MSRVYACFWFDVEDYITPESDHALKSLLDFFIERGTRGTWKIVGEKYRVLQARGRTDIIDLLHRQDVGYHTDNHSQHPTISEYEKGLGWEKGVEEFASRERRGFEELKQEFGVVSCYGQPGGAWAPQAFPVLSQWGIPMYLDEGRHLGLGKQSFWFQNILTTFNLQENCVRVDLRPQDRESALAEATSRFQAAVDRLKPTGGLVSIYYHPCEFATSEFWDGVNFRAGRNTPRDQWQGAPLLSSREAQARLRVFASFLDCALENADVEVVDATQLLAKYEALDPNTSISVPELARIASGLSGEISYAASSAGILSPSQIFSGLVRALATWKNEGSLPEKVQLALPSGPRRRAGSGDGISATLAEIAGAAGKALAESKASGYIPDFMVMEGRELAPAVAFRAMAVALQGLVQKGSGAEREALVIEPARLALEDQVGNDGREMWGWSIFPENFSAPDLLELTRLQAWTMKPAALK